MNTQKFLIAALAFAVAASFSQIASAQFDNPLKRAANSIKKETRNLTGKIKQTGGKINNSIRTEAGNASKRIKRAHNLNYKFTILNNSRFFIPYQINGQTQIGLTSKRGNKTRGMTFKGTGGTPTISFKNNRGKLIKYSLRNGTYEFKEVRGVLNLYKK